MLAKKQTNKQTTTYISIIILKNVHTQNHEYETNNETFE